MRIIKLNSSCYLVEGKAADDLQIGLQFKGETIVELRKTEIAGESYVEICMEKSDYKI